MGVGSIPKWDNHYKEEQDSTKEFWHLSFGVTISESKTILIAKICVEVWYRSTMDIAQSNRFKKKLSQYKILEKVTALFFSFILWKVSLLLQRAIQILPINSRLLTSAYLHLFRLSENAGTLKFSFLFTGMLGIPVCASIMGKQLTLTIRVKLFLQYSQANRYMSFH